MFSFFQIEKLNSAIGTCVTFLQKHSKRSTIFLGELSLASKKNT